MSESAGRSVGWARGAFASFSLLSSLYCLLAYIPFTYHQFLRFPHMRWLTLFETYHHLLAATLAVIVLWSLRGELRAPGPGRLAAMVAAVPIGAVVMLPLRPLLPTLRNDASSLAWSFAWLLPVAALATVDVLAGRRDVDWGPPAPNDPTRVFIAAGAAAVLLSFAYPLTALVRYGPETLQLDAAAGAAVWVVNLLSYLVLFAASFLLIAMVIALAMLLPRPTAAEFVFCVALAVFLVYALLAHVVLPGISFTGRAGAFFAIAFASVASAFVAGRKVRAAARSGKSVTSGLELALAPVGTLRSAAARAGVVVVLPPLAYVLAVRTASYDWNFIVQRLVVAIVLLFAFAAMYAAFPVSRGPRLRMRSMVVAAVLVLTVFVAGRWYWQPSTSLDRYAAHDVAFTLVREVLSPQPIESDPDFFSFLQANTNISRAARIIPVDVELVAELESIPEAPPHVFIIVVDSLRQDYLSAYDDSVTFTPELDSFARDSIVFEDAFTHYGATGLSQPSIWVGGMLLHQQYTVPFHPMNALDKLLRTHGYERFVSLDTILQVILPDPDDTVRLDAGRPDKDLDLCASLLSLEEKIMARRDPARPIFAYTQPQNLHISSITRAGNAPIDDGDYTGFFAPYASRLKRIDGCFGGFLGFLRDSGLYENSVIVFTSDHGDSLGEEGRWGHAYTIYPEIVRIPLMIRLPEGLAGAHVWDVTAPTFSTDITPTLYALLGHGPVIDRPFMGRPLFAPTPDELNQFRRPTHLLASSYGAVYGILDEAERVLFIADGVNFTEYLYDLTAGFGGASRRPTGDESERYRSLIRSGIEALGEFYGYVGIPANGF